MTETIESSTAAPEGGSRQQPGKKRGGGLDYVLLADLKSMAGNSASRRTAR